MYLAPTIVMYFRLYEMCEPSHFLLDQQEAPIIFVHNTYLTLLFRQFWLYFLPGVMAFVNLVLAVGCPSHVTPLFSCHRLLAVNKAPGSIWPIVIGFPFRQPPCKCANYWKAYFQPHQLRVGKSGVHEEAIQSAVCTPLFQGFSLWLCVCEIVFQKCI